MTNAADRASFGVLTQTFDPDLVEEVLAQGGALQQRRRELPARLTLYLVPALWLWRNLSYKEVWRRLADGCAFSGGDRHLAVPASGAPQASSITRARERLGVEPLALLFAHSAGPLATTDTPGAWCRGYRLSAVDGTCLDVPDTSANRTAFGDPTDGAFPGSARSPGAPSGSPPASAPPPPQTEPDTGSTSGASSHQEQHPKTTVLGAGAARFYKS